MAIAPVDSQVIENQLVHIAQKMVIAATTAPKARGLNQLSYRIATGDDILKLGEEMESIGQNSSQPFFIRDAKNILLAPVVVLLGCSINPINLKECSYCGHPNCGEKLKSPTHPCAHNLIDLGIAIGIAAEVAAQNHIDNRIMFSVGKAALNTHLFPEDVACIYAIPLSVSTKNIFFDRG